MAYRTLVLRSEHPPWDHTQYTDTIAVVHIFGAGLELLNPMIGTISRISHPLSLFLNVGHFPTIRREFNDTRHVAPIGKRMCKCKKRLEEAAVTPVLVGGM